MCTTRGMLKFISGEVLNSIKLYAGRLTQICTNLTTIFIFQIYGSTETSISVPQRCSLGTLYHNFRKAPKRLLFLACKVQ